MPKYTEDSPEVKNGKPPAPAGRVGRVGTGILGGPDLIQETMDFLAGYIVLPETSLLLIAAWVAAAWLADVWDRFPHLAITSPEKRCGKTRLLQLLELITPTPYNTSNISPAVMYRLIQQKRPTLLLDEMQSMKRRGSEASEVLRELFNAGIDRNAKVLRCGGENHDRIEEFSVYSPKVIALIGELDGVLNDRCLLICMKRKTAADEVTPYRSRNVKPAGDALSKQLQVWAQKNKKQVAENYDGLETFPIENDRMAELLLPLQAVLSIASPGRLELLGQYALSLDDRDHEQETQSPGALLLAACKQVFENRKGEAFPGKRRMKFIPTDTLIEKLVQRDEEPWHRWSHGERITREALAHLLRPFGIRSAFNKKRTGKGYYADGFKEPWERYVPAIPRKNASDPSNPSDPSSRSVKERSAGR